MRHRIRSNDATDACLLHGMTGRDVRLPSAPGLQPGPSGVQGVRGGAMPTVRMYKSNPCPYCTAAYRFLTEIKGVEVEE